MSNQASQIWVTHGRQLAIRTDFNILTLTPSNSASDADNEMKISGGCKICYSEYFDIEFMYGLDVLAVKSLR